LKSDAHLKTVPVILVSARAGEEARVEGLQAGADDYLVKPFNTRELLARVKANLNLELLHAKEQAEEAQAESEERFQALFHQAASGMAQTDLTGKFLLVNRRYCEMLGRSEEEMLHLHMQELTVPEDLPESLMMFERIKETGEPYAIEKRYIRSDGTLIWVRNYISLVRGRHAQPLSIMAVSQDITEQKESELAIQKAQSELKKNATKLMRSNRDLEHFAMIASHDLQEPLRKIMMFSDHLEIITQSYLTPEAKDDIDRLQRSTQKMQALIDNLLDLSRVTRNGHAFQRVNLSHTMREVQAELHSLLKETNGQIELGEMIEFEADASQIKQLLSILVNNALKFHREGVPPIVKLSSKFLDADYCQILVSDNGIGIKPEYQEKIFDAFVRLNSQYAYPGNGIGLTIAQKIVERHEGTIQVSSTPGQGSMFLVKLPIRQQNPVS
jgi:PAS domain S-box-containing protein